MRAAATTAATLLVIASAGFGATYAWTMGGHHGLALATLAVCMALGLELSKPFAIEGVFSCLRGWAIGRALAMAALGTVAVAYSLTAELSLMATTRGDAGASRSKVADATKDAQTELARLTRERAAMSFSPATAETVTAARGAVAAAERARKAECNGGRGPRCRAREADEGTARAALAKAIADKAATDRAAKLDARAETIRTRLAQSPVAAAADPGAAALASYLGTFGLNVPAAALSQWLVLVGVIALELGSALAVVLVRAAGVQRTASVIEPSADSRAQGRPDRRERPSPAAKPKATKASAKASGDVSRKSKGRPPRKAGQSASEVSKGKRAQAAILDTLKAKPGGKLNDASVRGLAAAVGGKRSTVHVALSALIATGVVAKVGAGLALASA